MSFHWRRHSAESKSALFRSNGGIGPAAKFKLPNAPCAFCPMPGTCRCDIPSCNVPICDKHRTRRAGGNLCKRHERAVLVQYDGVASTRFSDRGEAVPHR